MSISHLKAEFEASKQPYVTPEITLRQYPILSDDALYGIAGEIVNEATKESECDPAAILLQVLATCGALFGSGPYVPVGDSKHPPRLHTVIVGRSAKARKGTSWGPVKRILEGVQLADTMKVTYGSIVSGEGLIHAVRDAGEKVDDGGNPLDPGVPDKRLLIVDDEIATMFAARKRDGNTSSMIVRCAWDHGNIHPLTKTTPTKTTGAHIGIIGHITQDELKQLMPTVDIFNGFANRFLWCCAQRKKLVSRPVGLSDEFVHDVSERIASAVVKAKHTNQSITPLSITAGEIWDDLYPELSKEVPGITGSIIARAEPQVLRIALVFALLDKSAVVESHHLHAAYEVWKYCEASAIYLWGASETDDDKTKIVDLLKDGTMTLTDLANACRNQISKPDLQAKLNELSEVGAIVVEMSKSETGRGRPKTMISLATNGPKIA